MDKIEFGDINKFLVSIGLVLISLSIVTPYLYLKEDFGLYIERKKIKELAEVTQQLITNKQDAITFIQKSLPFISGGLFLLGSVFFVIGLVKWSKRQRKIDKKQDLEIEKLERELKSLTADEKIEKAKQEIKEIDLEQNIQDLPQTDSVGIRPDPAVLNYLRLESKIANIFSTYFQDHYEVFSQVKLGDKYEVDVLLKARDKRMTDLVVEIKYIRRTISYPVIRNFIQKMSQMAVYYSKHVSSRISPILIIIYSSEAVSQHQITELTDQIKTDKKRLPFMGHLKIEFVSENEIENMDLKRFG